MVLNYFCSLLAFAKPQNGAIPPFTSNRLLQNESERLNHNEGKVRGNSSRAVHPPPATRAAMPVHKPTVIRPAHFFHSNPHALALRALARGLDSCA